MKKLRLIGLFSLVIAMSFLPEMFPKFFGDFNCNGGVYEVVGNTLKRSGCLEWSNSHGPKTHWGFRHFVFFVMGLTLFIWGLVDLFQPKENEKNTDSKNSKHLPY